MKAEEAFWVYKITNLINGKLYFGVTKCSIRVRWNQHRHSGLRKKKHTFLANAIGKYGADNFKIESIKQCDSEAEMYQLEKDLIAAHQTNNREFGYNNSIGGEVSSTGMKHSDETKKRISEIQRGRKRNPHSESAKSNMREAAKGRDMTHLRGLSSAIRPGKVPVNKISVSQYSLNNEHIATFGSMVEAAKAVGGVPSAFNAIRKGMLKTYKSFLWQF